MDLFDRWKFGYNMSAKNTVRCIQQYWDDHNKFFAENQYKSRMKIVDTAALCSLDVFFTHNGMTKQTLTGQLCK